MKSLSYHLATIVALVLFSAFTSYAQTASAKTTPNNSITAAMKTYLIVREIPDAGKLTAAELKGISQTSCSVLREMGPKIEWIHSYVTGNQIYCVYKAENETLIREHAKKGGFPANSIVEVANIISPATAEK